MEEAFSALKSAKEIHDELENIYISAMDFETAIKAVYDIFVMTRI